MVKNNVLKIIILIVAASLCTACVGNCYCLYSVAASEKTIDITATYQEESTVHTCTATVPDWFHNDEATLVIYLYNYTNETIKTWIDYSGHNGNQYTFDVDFAQYTHLILVRCKPGTTASLGDSIWSTNKWDQTGDIPLSDVANNGYSLSW